MLSRFVIALDASGPVAGPSLSSSDTAQTSSGAGVSVSTFGTPIPITPPCH